MADEERQTVLNRIAWHMRSLRSSKGLTQESVAHRAGLVLRHYQKIEAAEVNLTVDSLVKVAGALDVDVSILLESLERDES